MLLWPDQFRLEALVGTYMNSFVVDRAGVLMALGFALTLVLVGCGPESTAQKLGQAKSHLEKTDIKAAVVELKVLLQQDPNSAEGRYLLGDALLRSGDPATAILELEKSKALGYDNNLLLPKLASCLLVTAQYKKVLELGAAMPALEPKAEASMKAALAAAYFATGQAEKGGQALDSALRLDPANHEAGILKARLIAGTGAFDDALARVALMDRNEPRRADILTLKGELLWLGKANHEAAAATLREALVIDPGYLPAHSTLIGVLLQRRDIDGFKAQVQHLKKALPNLPETRFYDAQLAYMDKDFRRAKDGARQLLQAAPENPYVLQLAGAIDFQLGALLNAEVRLSRALNILPKLVLARNILAETQLRQGQPLKALNTLQPLLDQARPLPESLALAAEAYVQIGDPAKSERLYQLAAAADPTDSRSRTALALAQISRGNSELGFNQLEQLAEGDKGTYADLGLVSALGRKGDLQGALKAVDRLQGKLAGKALPHLLRGQILLQMKDPAAARKSFDLAVAADPVNMPAVAALAALDVVEGQIPVAQKRFEGVLVRDPGNYRAILSLADLKQRSGAKADEVGKLLEEAVRLNQGEVAPRLALVDYSLSQRQVKAGLVAAQEAATAFPDDPAVADALGRALMASGDSAQAVNAFRKASAMQPSSAFPLLRLADAYVIERNFKLAEQTLHRALEVSPKLVIAQEGLIRIAMVQKRVADALKIAATVQRERPSESVGYVLEAEIHAGQQAWPAAQAALNAGLQRDRSGLMAIRVHKLDLAAGQTAEAERFLVAWIKDHPSDSEFLFYAATQAMQLRDFAAAEQRFRRLQDLLPDNPSAPNNIAWVLLQQAKPGALDFAERAQKLLPDNAAIVDTVAAALAADKQFDKAAERQRRAVDLAPGEPAYRLKLARYLIAANDRAAAKLQLEQLSALGDKFQDQAAVKALLQAP